MPFLTSKEGRVAQRHQHNSEQFSYCMSGGLTDN
jgi:quercetin dioxygenase-like cupin family protein